jgi:hypothetical protein
VSAFDHSFVNPRPRGPYGTNEGDTWFASDELNDLVKADKGPGWACLIYVKTDDATGQPTPAVFVTENPELIEEARQGTILWANAQAANN